MKREQKKEYAKLISFILGLTFIIAGITFSVTQVYKENRDKKRAEEILIIDEIVKDYETFNAKAEEFSEKRTDINDDMSSYTSYYLNMFQNYDDMMKELEDYEALLKEVDESGSYLKNNCISKTYSSADANHKCNTYIMNLEKSINSFVSDISFLNNKIDEYNEWIKTNKEEKIIVTERKKKVQKTIVYENLDTFSPKYYKDYVDINNDGTYLGKNAD